MRLTVPGASMRRSREATWAQRALDLLCTWPFVAALLGAFGVFAPAQAVKAFEAFDGRFQLHGFYEMQVRTISRDFQDDFDLTQWYHILNLETELEILQDQWGPFDLVSGFMRIEGRFDCIYSRGCGLVSAADTFGDRAKSLPRRLSNAVELKGAGVIPLPELGVIDYANRPRDPRRIDDIPIFRTLFEVSNGADKYAGNPQESDACQTRYGPYVAGSVDSACAYLGGGDNSPVSVIDDPLPPVFQRFEEFRFTAIDWRGSANFGSNYLLMGPWLPKNKIQPVASMADIPNPLDNSNQPPQLAANFFNGELINKTLTGGLQARPDWIGNYPVDPAAETQTDRRIAAINFQDAVSDLAAQLPTISSTGALPYRPIPVVDAGGRGVVNDVARGLYLPSEPMRRLANGGTLSKFPFNFSETERSFNRGESQRQTGELKEIYLDIEMFDARLWLRLGRQNIVWGKTELFSATDQFNPQDFALASLPSLEESRIPLWAFRGVYSFYDVWKLSDVRFELAAIFDKFQGADLGACGEPYAVDLICGLTFGAFAHGFTGIGVAGVEKPGAPWEGSEGWQIGGRLEFRWDRFSFAISDFYGFDKFPHPNRIATYERNVDPYTGLPRRYGARGRCQLGYLGSESPCLQPGPTDRRLSVIDDRLEISDGMGGSMPNPTFGEEVPNPNYDADLADTAANALDFHSANQQLFAFVCSTTIGVAGSTAPASCGASAFNGQDAPLPGQVFTPAQLLSASLAGGDESFSLILFKLGQELRPSSEAGLLFLTIPPVVRLSADSNDQSNLIGGVNGVDSNCSDDTWANNQDNIEYPNARVATCGGRGFTAFQVDRPGEDNGRPGLADLLTPEQEALLGCGPFWGTNCDISGIDWLNAEGSVLIQSFPGIEGTGLVEDGPEVWLDANGNVLPKTSRWRTDIAQIQGRNQNGQLVTRNLPQPGTLGFQGGPVASVAHINGGDPIAKGYRLPGARAKYRLEGGAVVPNDDCRVTASLNCWDPRVDGEPDAVSTSKNLTLFGLGYQPAGLAVHPLTGQRWDNELAALSWNFLGIVALGSDDFLLDNAYVAGECSFITPQLCDSVRGLLTLMSARRNDVRAGGNTQFGRRDFQWHGGGVVTLDYEKRNVLGFATDFAEDRTKANFGIEFSWVNGVPMVDNNTFDGITKSDEFNLTVSVDRPTFVNFLNANRSFFINSQWFFQYRTNYNSGFTANGPWNVLGTLTILTGFHQDRLNPQITGVYDFQSRSGGLLTQFEYRVSAAFSLAVGLNYFFGRTQQVVMPLNGIAPGQNYAFDANNRYKEPTDQLLSAIRNRDELFMRIRYSF